MDIFEQPDYKAAIRAFVASLPKGRGELARLARAARIHPTLLSQILNGSKHLTLEQACLLADHIGLTDAGTDFFLGLVEHERAGSEMLRRRITARLRDLRAAHLEIKNRLPKTRKPLTESEQAIFYSDWFYSAVRLLTSVPQCKDVDSIAARLDLPRTLVSKIASFLVEKGLCVASKSGLDIGQKRTHISNDSPFIRVHHRNWRIRGMQRLESGKANDLFFTAPLTISIEDATRLRKLTLELIEKAGKIVDPSPPEELYCLNIDLFAV